MEAAADAIERGAWKTEEARFAELPGRGAYRLSPASDRLLQKTLPAA